MKYTVEGLLLALVIQLSLQVEEQKQAAVDVLNNYSQFAMVCIGEEVRPCDLRLHLMKVNAFYFLFYPFFDAQIGIIYHSLFKNPHNSLFMSSLSLSPLISLSLSF